MNHIRIAGFMISLAFSMTNNAFASSIHLNQYGFLPAAAKWATVVTEQKQPLEWEIISKTGETLLSGRSQYFGFDKASGANTHWLDFSGFQKVGNHYRLRIGCLESSTFNIHPRLYSQMKYDALSFFYHQRSGIPIESRYVGKTWARPKAHAPDKATCYGPKDFRGNHWGGCPYTLDVSKGWYDAGDHGKYVVNGGISVWTLLNYVEHFDKDRSFDDGKVRLPEHANGINDIMDEAKWHLDFMLAMQVPERTTLTLPRGNQANHSKKLYFSKIKAAGLVHHKMGNEHWTALPTLPHLDTEKRYLHYPSTAATLNLAAVAAQASRIWKKHDPGYAERTLKAAVRAYHAAKRVPDLYAIMVTEGGTGPYDDVMLDDEFYWAAAELFITTGERQYLEDAKQSSKFLALPLSTASGRDPFWQSVEALGTLSLLQHSYMLKSHDARLARKRLQTTADRLVNEMQNEGFRIPFTRSYDWGSNGAMANRGILLGTAYALFRKPEYLDGMTAILDYLLGKNILNRSYVALYGSNPFTNPHHRFWLRTLDKTLPPPPAGALAGGPNIQNPHDEVAKKLVANGCAPQSCYADDTKAYALNEVAINWNAPFFWVTAAYDHFAHHGNAP